AATVMTYFAVRISDKPADAEHHYGHGKMESVSALAETALLFLLCGVVIWEALQRLLGAQAHPVEATFWSFAVIIGSIAVDFVRARLLYRAAAESGSEALAADALHFGSDMWSSVAVLLGLLAVARGHAWADAAAAVVVAAFICIAGWRLGRRTIDTLTDTAPAGAAERITALVEKIPGVVSVERVRVRQAGGVPFVHITVAVSRTLALDRVAVLKERIAQAIHTRFPKAELTINSEPRALDSESVLEQVMVIARNRSLAVHHVTVQAIGAQLSVSLDLEVDGRMTLGAAHEIASDLEEAVRSELGPAVEVETHIEPLQPHDQPGLDASPQRIAAVQDALAEIATRFAAVSEVHDVRVRQSDGVEIVNFHCRVDPALTVAQVHERVDDVERALRERFPAVKRVIGHAEPRPA
ncbi:MAG: cation diffusion facilitator family transporter, partial [Acetobacteraceae bacterium]|nr:cation diffusion facilitator family transporter [Acetobacteraceae bacterium]